ncbi:MAG: ABC transporter ATP-binding protein [Bacteroidetes bacterium]|nr:ABC transporter ATP-binding protein [Bacteroidota bacterium]
MYSIQTNDLSYHYSPKEQILNNICLQIPTGSIYGFLGPNGAGKTTTLRLLLGLLSNQHGDIEIFNKPFSTNRIEILKNIGTLIESPSIYAHLTASENLRVWQKLYQCPLIRIQKVLELVGLSDVGNKKAGKFSLGMKQRLAIAVALLHEPKLLILDEPTNGLDPNGILEMRLLLQKLNSELGITILISSHILSEIEKLVTHIGIIHKGELLMQGTLQELMNKQQLSNFIVLDTSSNEKAFSILSLNIADLQINNNKIILPFLEKSKIAEINQLLVKQKIDVYEISPEKNDLENIFMQLINKN